MKTLAEIQQILAQNKALLQEKYHVTDLGIFGDYATFANNREKMFAVIKAIEFKLEYS